jgi:chromosome segregation ATPase
MAEEILSKSDSYSVKTTSDVTERVQELTKKTGLSHKDLFAAMVTRYYTELETGSEIDKSDDMQQIRYHLNRAENIFLGSLQKVQDLKKDYTRRLEDQNAQYKDVLEDLQKQKSNLSKELDKLIKEKGEAENRFKEIQQRNIEFEETNRANRMTIDLLGHKVKDLEGKLTEASILFENTAQLQDENLTLKQEYGNLQVELDTAHQVNSKLGQQLTEAEVSTQLRLNSLTTESEKEMQRLRDSFDIELKQLKEIHKLEIDKVHLEAERRVLEREQTVKVEYGQKLDLLLDKNDRLLAKNQDLTDKLFIQEHELRNRATPEGDKET